jgi:hypothetical protein
VNTILLRLTIGLLWIFLTGSSRAQVQPLPVPSGHLPMETMSVEKLQELLSGEMRRDALDSLIAEVLASKRLDLTESLLRMDKGEPQKTD